MERWSRQRGSSCRKTPLDEIGTTFALISGMSAGQLFPTFLFRSSDLRRKAQPSTGSHSKAPPRRQRYRYLDDADYRAEYVTTPYGRRRRTDSRRLKVLAAVSAVIVVGGLLCLLL